VNTSLAGRELSKAERFAAFFVRNYGHPDFFFHPHSLFCKLLKVAWGFRTIAQRTAFGSRTYHISTKTQQVRL
jgi:hypothetical protein